MVDLDDLRAWGTGCGSRGYKLCHDVADEIERLRSELAAAKLSLTLAYDDIEDTP